MGRRNIQGPEQGAEENERTTPGREKRDMWSGKRDQLQPSIVLLILARAL